jgi:hypothetical protein
MGPGRDPQTDRRMIDDSERRGGCRQAAHLVPRDGHAFLVEEGGDASIAIAVARLLPD